VNDRRRRGFLPAIVSIVDILSGAAPLIVDVRPAGSGSVMYDERMAQAARQLGYRISSPA
jgi:hypothetical protein